MRPILRIVLVCLAALTVLPAAADEPAEAIQSVIERQLSAFQANDVDTAFGFAAPGIQRKFGDPETFGRMVQQGYPMVWRPTSYRIGRLLETEAGPVQIVVFEDAAGKLHEAGYLMTEIDGAWRIAGVHLRVLPGVGT